MQPPDGPLGIFPYRDHDRRGHHQHSGWRGVAELGAFSQQGEADARSEAYEASYKNMGSMSAFLSALRPETDMQRQLLGPIGVARYVEYAQHIYDSGAHLLVQVEEMLGPAVVALGWPARPR